MDLRRLAGCALALSIILAPLAGTAKNEEKLDTTDRYIVTLADAADNDGVAARHEVQRLKKYSKALNGFAGKLSEKQLEKLKADPEVLSVEADVVVQTSAKAAAAKPAPAQPAQATPTGVNRAEGDLSVTARIDKRDERVNVDVAVIDTGIQLNHPDLNVFRNVNMINPQKTGADDNGHGTHVAGTIGALDNANGVVGMAPGARLWAVKVLNANGSGFMSDIIEGVDYVTANAASIEVANMSLGCDNCSSAALATAIRNSVAKGVVYVVAAGNSSLNAANSVPANHPDVLAVSAIADFDGLPGGSAAATCRSDVDDTFADFSNYGAVVDIAAPGVCIRSTWTGGGYSTISGTSMASPHVAGAVALYLSARAKPTDAAGVAAVRLAVTAAATAQSATGGFTGDPDSFAEPLLNVQTF